MEIKKLTILGKSDATITMILDNLESNNTFPIIEIINNLSLPIEHPIYNPKFITLLKSEMDEISVCCLGVFNPNSKISTLENFNFDFKKLKNIYHKSCEISSTSQIGIGCMINSLSSIAAHTKIGDFVSINRNVSIGHHTTIGDFTTINPGVNIGGNVNIGEMSTVGMGTNIFNGVSIGKNTIVGAGSLVTKNIPDNVIAYGNPCKIIRENV